ncbi:hypothetical protein AB0D14_39245 [Streptomyces sp. NPDC048484]|uniref:hypothetical protein n=1 Tax=Streptomyces sp. NPDC048484 TaxID=3155146 RepID=UPI003439AB14
MRGRGDQAAVVADGELEAALAARPGVAQVADHEGAAVCAPRITTVHFWASGSSEGPRGFTAGV